ncbi:glucosamine inositolphosphorylceramide transferase family protein [Aristophania vespae]
MPESREGCSFSDPFGIWQDDKLYVFVKALNEQTFKSGIYVLIYDSAFNLLETRSVLEEKWNLAYPYVFEHKGEIYMLPDAHESGRLTLYRAQNFPYEWEKLEGFNFPLSVMNATILHHAGRWWMFWSPAMSVKKKRDSLHIAIAEDLLGPWADMGCFLTDLGGALPGGSPIIDEDALLLPVRQNRRTEGGGLRFLRFEGFGNTRPLLIGGRSLGLPPSLEPAYPDGMHTLSAAGSVTLVDVKKERYSLRKSVNLFKKALKLS